jgi:CheY-like chemotaxis protein
MDIMMPEMDGLTATRAIRSMNRTDMQTIPVIAMTANAFAEDKKAALEAGMNGYVTKPIDIAMLIEEIKTVVVS